MMLLSVSYSMDPTSEDIEVHRSTASFLILTMAAVAVLAIGILMLTAVSDDSDADDSGTCGGSLSWTFEDATGKLSITRDAVGSGTMTNFGPTDVRWGGHEVKSVDFSGVVGPATIGTYAFSGCTSLKSVTFSNYITGIGDYAFNGCTSLEVVTLPDDLTSIGDHAFSGCTGLKHLTFNTNIGSAYGGSVDPEAFATTGLYDSDAVTPMTITGDNLMGREFFSVDGKLSWLVRVFLEIGSDFSVASAFNDQMFDVVNIAYLKDAALKDAAMTLSIIIPGGYTAVFDSAAIQSWGDDMAIFEFVKVNNASLDEATKALVGTDPVYSITFGGNTSFGTGKVTYTFDYSLPAGGDPMDIRVHYITAGTFAEEMPYNYSMGKITFESNHLSLYSVQLGDAPVPPPAPTPTTEYTIQLKLNGGESSTVSSDNGWVLSGDTWSKSFSEGSALTIEAPSKDGHSFKGWNPALPSTVTADGLYEANYSKNSSLDWGISLWVIIGVGIVIAVGYASYYIISNTRKKS